MATKKKKKTQDKASMIKNATERAKKIKNIRRIERGLGIRGATGNIATEDTVNLFNELGLDTGMDIKNLAAISRSLVPVIGEKYFSGKLYKIN